MALTRGYGSYPQVIHRVIHRPPKPKISPSLSYQRLLGLILLILYRELSHVLIATAAILK